VKEEKQECCLCQTTLTYTLSSSWYTHSIALSLLSPLTCPPYFLPTFLFLPPFLSFPFFSPACVALLLLLQYLDGLTYLLSFPSNHFPFLPFFATLFNGLPFLSCSRDVYLYPLFPLIRSPRSTQAHTDRKERLLNPLLLGEISPISETPTTDPPLPRLFCRRMSSYPSSALGAVTLGAGSYSASSPLPTHSSSTSLPLSCPGRPRPSLSLPSLPAKSPFPPAAYPTIEK
jgi:hypothetical protein